MSMRSWLRDVFAPRTPRTARESPDRVRLAVEALEVRIVPKTPGPSWVPAISLNQAAVVVNEAGPAANVGTFNDTQGRSTVTLTASLGTVTKNDAAGTWNWAYTPPDNTPAPTTVTITATDNTGRRSSKSFTLTVDNVAPTITAFTVPAGSEGRPVTLSAAATDPSPVDQAAGFGYSINWGDGTAAQAVARAAGNGGGVTLSHAYLAPGTYTVTLTATDKDGGARSATRTVTILP